jgi:hypothetical protein
MAVSVGLVAFVICYDPAYRWLCASSRMVAIQTLPYWDWTKYYNEECLVRNPYYQGSTEQLFEEDCQVCEHMERVERISNMSQYVMADSYIKRDIPVIIMDATDQWPARQLFTLKFLHELYETEDLLKSSPPCLFTSSVHQRSLNVRSLLAMAHNGQLSQWFAHWENCEHKSVRLMRRFYRRPSFLPPMVEAINRNWIFVSSRYNAKTFKHVDMSSPLMWMAQLRGQNKIRFTPRQPCNSTCRTFYTVLHEGETVVWTDFMWLLDYLPIDAGDHFNVAIGSGGSFD